MCSLTKPSASGKIGNMKPCASWPMGSIVVWMYLSKFPSKVLP